MTERPKATEAVANAARRREYVPEEEVVGAVVVSVETWGPVTVEKDGRTYEIRSVEGHSGPENLIREVVRRGR